VGDLRGPGDGVGVGDVQLQLLDAGQVDELGAAGRRVYLRGSPVEKLFSEVSSDAPVGAGDKGYGSSDFHNELHVWKEMSKVGDLDGEAAT